MNVQFRKPANFIKCYQCGSTEDNQPTEMLSILFPERRREFCCWRCAFTFLESAKVWREDPRFIVRFLGNEGQSIGVFTSK